MNLFVIDSKILFINHFNISYYNTLHEQTIFVYCSINEFKNSYLKRLLDYLFEMRLKNFWINHLRGNNWMKTLKLRPRKTSYKILFKYFILGDRVNWGWKILLLSLCQFFVPSNFKLSIKCFLMGFECFRRLQLCQ